MSDLISRADAIDAIDDAIDADSPQWAILRTKIGFLPSAELPKGDMISRADAIERIANDNVVGGMKRINEYCDSTEHNDYLDGISTAIATVDDLPSAEAEWIPCSKRLPRTGDDILVTFSDGEVDIIISARPKAWVKYEEANNLIFPVAWMPLPKPYRKDGEDDGED